MSEIEVHRALDRARDLHHEDHDGSLAEAIRCHEIGAHARRPAVRCRALVLQAAVALQRGDLHGAVELISEAEPHARDDAVRSELAAVKGQLSFFAGSYAESLAQAERAIELADGIGVLELRLFARRQACVVFGNIGVSDWHARLHEVLQLAIDAGSPWEEAMSRNDLAHYTMEQGDLDGRREPDRPGARDSRRRWRRATGSRWPSSAARGPRSGCATGARTRRWPTPSARSNCRPPPATPTPICLP